MFNARLLVERAVTIVAIAMLCVLATTAAHAQSAAALDDQFAAYHNTLNTAADDLLAATTQPSITQRADEAPLPPPATDNFTSALARVQRLRPLLEPILREEGVPTDLAAIVLVESGGRATALSPKGARGLWQLMPETARRYGLTIAPAKDERTDVVQSTRAAARYLRDLHAQFGDWSLAFAAYNAGEPAVQRAMNRTGSTDFQRLRQLLPYETRAYVPAVMTALPLFGGTHKFAAPMLRAARAANVLYASTKLED